MVTVPPYHRFNSVVTLGLIASQFFLPSLVGGQPVDIRLGKPTLVTEAQFTVVTSAVRLPSGAILVADASGAKEFSFIDGVTGKISVIGREGSGPGEYWTPQFVLPFKTGALLVDPPLRRISEFDARAKFVKSTPFPVALAGSSIPMTRSVDLAGTFYFVAPALGGAALRINPTYSWRYPDGVVQAIRVLGTLRGPKFSTGAPQKPGTRAAGISMFRVPYSDWDAFAGLSDGTLFVARSESRTVEWLDSAGQKLQSMPFPGVRTAVPDSVKNSVRPVFLQDAMDEYYAPFDGELSVRSSADRVWLRAIPINGDSATWYGFRRSEKQPMRMTLHRSAQLIGAFEPYLIVARRTESEFQRIEVYRLPR